MKNILLIIFSISILLPSTVIGQASSKSVQAGMTFNAGANFLSPGTTKIEANGAGSLLSIGVTVNAAAKSSENLGLSTGLEFDFGKNIYSPNNATNYTYVDYIEGEVLSNEVSGAESLGSYATMQLVSRRVSTTKLSVPLMLLFRTNFIGDFRYFGKFGIRNTFLLTHEIKDDGIATTLGIPNGEAVVNDLMSSPGEFFIYNGSVGISAGAEWNFVGSTCLVLEAGYYYGITPFFLDRKDGKKTMYNYGTELIFPPTKNYYSASARQNQLIFKLSILF